MTSPFEPSESAPAGPPGSTQPDPNEKLWVLLAYVFSPVVPLIIMLMPDIKNLPYVRQHNMQALASGVALWLVVMEIPVRMRQNRMHPVRWESPPGFKCQTRSTSRNGTQNSTAYCSSGRSAPCRDNRWHIRLTWCVGEG